MRPLKWFSSSHLSATLLFAVMAFSSTASFSKENNSKGSQEAIAESGISVTDAATGVQYRMFPSVLNEKKFNSGLYGELQFFVSPLGVIEKFLDEEPVRIGDTLVYRIKWITGHSRISSQGRR